jgi:hypothetical protein
MVGIRIVFVSPSNCGYQRGHFKNFEKKKNLGKMTRLLHKCLHIAVAHSYIFPTTYPAISEASQHSIHTSVRSVIYPLTYQYKKIIRLSVHIFLRLSISTCLSRQVENCENRGNVAQVWILSADSYRVIQEERSIF